MLIAPKCPKRKVFRHLNFAPFYDPNLLPGLAQKLQDFLTKL